MIRMSRSVLRNLARAVGVPATVVTFACVVLLVAGHVQSARNAPRDKERIETLEQAARKDGSRTPVLREELDRQTEASLDRKVTVGRIVTVLIVASIVFLLCAKTLTAIRGRRSPALSEILAHRAGAAPGKRPRRRKAAACATCRGGGAEASPADLAFVDDAIDRTGRGKEAVIPLLHAIQAHERYLPAAALQRICERTEITPAQISGVSSFYSQFRTSPVGEHIVKACHGTACHVAGAPAITEEIHRHLGIEPGGDTDPQRRFTVEKVACLGCCTLAPVVQIEETTYGHLAPDTVSGVLDDFLESNGGRTGRREKVVAARPHGDDSLLGEIRVGLDSCCVAGGSAGVHEALMEAVAATGAAATVKHVGCQGMCSLTPLVEIVQPGRPPVLYTSVVPEDARAIVGRHFKPRGITRKLKGTALTALERLQKDSTHDRVTRCSTDYRDPVISTFLGRQKQITTEHCNHCDPTDLDDYVRLGGFDALKRCLVERSTEETIEEIRRSGLRGRGGAGYPTAEKWSKVQRAEGPVKYVVVNGDEGDPGAFMDRMLMESVPFRVIEGAAIAALCVGAREGYFYIRAEYPLATKRIKEALRLCEERGLLGATVRLTVMEGAGAFVCGEETALLRSIEGDRGSPRIRPPFPSESGLRGKPTLVNNVETLATIPWILRNGSAAFAALGTATSKGTKVFSLAGKVRRGGLIEVPMGVTLRDIVHEIGGGIRDGHAFKAVQIGGPSGGCVPADLADTAVDFEALTGAGAIMGSGGLVVLDDTDCMVDVARYFLSFTQDQSCGKCTFCRIGTKRMLEILDRLCSGEGRPADLEVLERTAAQVTRGSVCGLGKTAPNPVLSTLRHFRDEYEAHIQGRCPAGKCKALITFRITDRCVGCTLCTQHCPAEAIPYTPYQKHVIDTEKCTRCGTCMIRCPENAIEVT